jgi:hypothetical protein
VTKQDALSGLTNGQLHRFADWPIHSVPKAPGIYTIWRGSEFLYVGIAGRGDSGQASGGLWRRLSSHASGRRSGDQLCIYVCDRLVLPRLAERLGEVEDGRLSLDAVTRTFIRQELGFRLVAMTSYAEAQELETRVKRVGLPNIGRPLLNPGSTPD